MFLLLQMEIVLDAWMTGAYSPLLSNGIAARNAAIAFVILGDLRFFYLVERQRGAVVRALAFALPVSLIVPVTTGVLQTTDPLRFSGNRLYLVYEVALLVLAFAFGRARRPEDEGRRRYVRRLLWVEAVQYVAWVAADALIVYGRGSSLVSELSDLGWLLRMVPNAIYYAAFVPIATWATPAEARA
jgi:hypothetical protein